MAASVKEKPNLTWQGFLFACHDVVRSDPGTYWHDKNTLFSAGLFMWLTLFILKLYILQTARFKRNKVSQNVYLWNSTGFLLNNGHKPRLFMHFVLIFYVFFISNMDMKFNNFNKMFVFVMKIIDHIICSPLQTSIMRTKYQSDIENNLYGLWNFNIGFKNEMIISTQERLYYHVFVLTW